MVEVWAMGEMEWIKGEFKPNQACWLIYHQVQRGQRILIKIKETIKRKRRQEKKKPSKFTEPSTPTTTGSCASQNTFTIFFLPFNFISSFTRWERPFDSDHAGAWSSHPSRGEPCVLLLIYSNTPLCLCPPPDERKHELDMPLTPSLRTFSSLFKTKMSNVRCALRNSPFYESFLIEDIWLTFLSRLADGIRLCFISLWFPAGIGGFGKNSS